jgi:hypothetical protein
MGGLMIKDRVEMVFSIMRGVLDPDDEDEEAPTRWCSSRRGL